jgi:hypothetical protein
MFSDEFHEPGTKKRYAKKTLPPLFHQSSAERQNPLENQRNVLLASSVSGYFYINLPSTLFREIVVEPGFCKCQLVRPGAITRNCNQG